jgi:hypothetical protein
MKFHPTRARLASQGMGPAILAYLDRTSEGGKKKTELKRAQTLLRPLKQTKGGLLSLSNQLGVPLLPPGEQFLCFFLANLCQLCGRH